MWNFSKWKQYQITISLDRCTRVETEQNTLCKSSCCLKSTEENHRDKKALNSTIHLIVINMILWWWWWWCEWRTTFHSKHQLNRQQTKQLITNDHDPHKSIASMRKQSKLCVYLKRTPKSSYRTYVRDDRLIIMLYLLVTMDLTLNSMRQTNPNRVSKYTIM